MRKKASSKQAFDKASSPHRATLSTRGIAAKRCIISAGETFDDGTVIELVSGSSASNKPHLLLWNGKKERVGSRVEHGGCVYEAPELPPGLYRATRFPSGCDDYGSERSLFTAIADLPKQYLDLPEEASGRLAGFCMTNWLADCLPTAVNLTISGADLELGVDVLRLLHAVCRHPLMLAEVTLAGLRSLPMQLSPTLLLNQQGLTANMQRLLRASNYRDLHFTGNGGDVVKFYGSKAIFCGNDAAVEALSNGSIHISATPLQWQSCALDERGQNEIANKFQRRLLQYRLRNCRTLGESSIDVSNFTYPMRRIARALAACFPKDPELARDVVQLLRPQDEELRSRQSCDLNCVIVEILWGMVHDRKMREIRVDELAKDATALLRSRGEILEYGAEAVGWKLRNLNIPRHSTSSGRQVLLGRHTSQSVHRLAQAYGLPCTQQVAADCPDCNQSKPTLSM
jgi:hypothetical protein